MTIDPIRDTFDPLHDNYVIPAEDILSVISNVMFDNIDVGFDNNNLSLVLRGVPVRYVWNTHSHVLEIEYYDLKGLISHSLIMSAWEDSIAVDIFCQLLLAAKKCAANNTPYVFYIRNDKSDPHRAFTSWWEFYNPKQSVSFVFRTRIYPVGYYLPFIPRRKRSAS